MLFNESIGYNLRYGRHDASDEEVRQAARRAQIHDAIERMPQVNLTLTLTLTLTRQDGPRRAVRGGARAPLGRAR